MTLDDCLQAAMQQPARTARRARGEIILLHQERREARRRQMLGRTRAIDAGADHSDVKLCAIQFG